jgi:hypothetical protein
MSEDQIEEIDKQMKKEGDVQMASAVQQGQQQGAQQVAQQQELDAAGYGQEDQQNDKQGENK